MQPISITNPNPACKMTYFRKKTYLKNGKYEEIPTLDGR